MSSNTQKANREKLLGRAEAAARFGLKPRSFRRIKARLIADGLQEVLVGRTKMYRSSSIDRMIARAAEKGTPLGEVTE